MNKEEVLIENFIKNNPFDFKQGIISHCRHMDKLDVYEWVAEDELKIQQLKQENEKLKHYKKLYQILKREKEELRKWLSEQNFDDIDTLKVLDKMYELEEVERISKGDVDEYE